MVAAQIKDGRAHNVIILPDDFAADTWDGLPIIRGASCGPGDIWDGVRFERAAPEAAPLTRRDSLRAKLQAGTATQTEMAEALAMLL